MGKKDPRVDAYIAKANPFARPILDRLRQWTHRHCPECEETLKWSAPHFDYQGKIYCGMSAFKEHCAFGFWHPLMRKDGPSVEGMGSFGKIRTLADLPSEAAFAKMARKAKRLTDEGVKAPPKPRKERAPLRVPADLKAALAKNRRAQETFDAFPYSCRKEYVEWITEAKREETRTARVAQSVEWMAQGKRHNWKYER